VKIRLLAAGTRMPGWVDTAYADYAGRMPRECALELREIPLGRRSGGRSDGRAVAAEGERMLKAITPGDRVVALDVTGRSLDTEALSRRLAGWLQDGRDVVLTVGGPDGLAPPVVDRAEWRWSLSPLTLPHGLVRVVLAEQLYRAWTVLAGHPYHRA
jgi:23S rRNA (pseudouridine1915-N3)-methyltransferase